MLKSLWVSMTKSRDHIREEYKLISWKNLGMSKKSMFQICILVVGVVHRVWIVEAAVRRLTCCLSHRLGIGVVALASVRAGEPGLILFEFGLFALNL